MPASRSAVLMQAGLDRRKLSAVLLTQADTHSATQSFAMIRLGNQLRLTVPPTANDPAAFRRQTAVGPSRLQLLKDCQA